VIKLTTPGFQVVVEKDAGIGSHFSDATYEAAGAKVVSSDDVWKSDIVLKVRTTTHVLLMYEPFSFDL
jgi:alanine dehydrogenase